MQAQHGIRTLTNNLAPVLCCEPAVFCLLHIPGEGLDASPVYLGSINAFRKQKQQLAVKQLTEIHISSEG